jgi:hypothetical protein
MRDVLWVGEQRGADLVCHRVCGSDEPWFDRRTSGTELATGATVVAICRGGAT